ncbi:MAG TPA: helix-turn-helix domain-containing protein [Nitrospira sp.]|nr:helix-turn-helix domain-containing protein [Nitrospira sp.]
MLRERRTQYGLSQTDLAKRLQSSQSRVAKMEAGDPKGTIRPWTEVLGLR